MLTFKIRNSTLNCFRGDIMCCVIVNGKVIRNEDLCIGCGECIEAY
ncbi:4Fe-4S binding protein [Clostridium sp.]